MTEVDLLLALRDCYDPELRCNIVDLGLVQAVEVTPDLEAPGAGIAGVPPRYRVVVEITPANPDEVAVGVLRGQILNRLAGMEAVSCAVVNVLGAPAWTPGRISPAGRRQMGLDGNPTLVQIR